MRLHCNICLVDQNSIHMDMDIPHSSITVHVAARSVDAGSSLTDATGSDTREALPT